jgi:Family of unknown function (DUF5681)
MPKKRIPRPSDYVVGYGKPPKEGQFGPGNNANPKGRPRHRKEPEPAIFRVLEEKLVVVERGKRRRLPAEEIILLKQRAKAMGGDVRAAKFLDEQKLRCRKPEKPFLEELELSGMSDEDLNHLERLMEKAVAGLAAKR